MSNELTELEKVMPLPGLLGYLNFSEGRPDARFAKQLNEAHAFLIGQGEARPWQALRRYLGEALARLQQSDSSAFRDVTQAEAVLRLVLDEVIPAYRHHHCDLLAHLSEADFYAPFFLVRVCEAVLGQRGPWAEKSRIVAGALKQLNDFVGHRPIAILESRPQGEPYEHERCRPIPLYLRGAGVAQGSYQRLLQLGLDILQGTDPGLLNDAGFDLEVLEELALDPRGYDFGHPANKRPNYVFGEWDPHHLDSQGRFCRYVARQVTLDGLLERVSQPGPLAVEEVLWEAAAVFAGTLLMASGVSGATPQAHDSTVTLDTLVRRIARYREAFYASWLQRRSGSHGERLRQEASLTRQPLGGARQHLNQYLARQKAGQLQQRLLALLLAEIGYPDASRRQVQAIPVPSIRLLAEMHISLTTGQLLTKRGELGAAAGRLAEVEELLRRGIACGAVVDPWNILGFQGQYPRFVALEDSVRDPRVDDLVRVVDRLFYLYAQILSEGAATGQLPNRVELSRAMRRSAQWWDRYATTTVGDVPHVHGAEVADAAEQVAQALASWHQRGAASADLAFWRQQLEKLRTPKAFALVVNALLSKEDFQAAMALLITWLDQAEQVPLEAGEHSFHPLVLRWLLGVVAQAKKDSAAAARELIVKFFDYLEANAEEYWEVPRLAGHADDTGAEGEEEEEEVDLYGAAYEEVTYQDTTDDEGEADILDIMPQRDFDLEEESERLERRLRFLATLARLWIIASRPLQQTAAVPETAQPLAPWLARARHNCQALLELLDAVHEHPIPKPSGSYESLVEFDRRRLLKERLLGTVIGACLETALAAEALQGTLGSGKPSPGSRRPAWEPLVLQLEQALWQGEAVVVRTLLPTFVRYFRQEPLLYTPLSHAGHPRQILRASIAQTILRGLVANLPRLGLLRETFQLLRTAQVMERAQALMGPRVTEFDRLFEIGCRAIVEAVVESTLAPSSGLDESARSGVLVDLLGRLCEPFLALWREHSRTLRVAILEALPNDSDWARLREFIQRYGHDLFHARFLTLGNLRGILHRGVGAYLDYLRDNPDPLRPVRLIDDLDEAIPRLEAERHLELILQAVIENYEEYSDFNSTTAQSDFGENLYQLLDFLRLKASYERQTWQLRPLVLIHEVLARRYQPAALFWQQQLARLTQKVSDQLLQELARLEAEHGMRLTTVADRLQERFVQPLALDRLCALLEPAMQAVGTPAAAEAERQLEEALRPYCERPTGVGLEVPNWLRRLETERQRIHAAHTALASLAETIYQVPKMVMSLEDLQQQLRGWEVKESLPP